MLVVVDPLLLPTSSPIRTLEKIVRAKHLGLVLCSRSPVLAGVCEFAKALGFGLVLIGLVLAAVQLWPLVY